MFKSNRKGATEQGMHEDDREGMIKGTSFQTFQMSRQTFKSSLEGGFGKRKITFFMRLH